MGEPGNVNGIADPREARGNEALATAEALEDRRRVTAGPCDDPASPTSCAESARGEWQPRSPTRPRKPFVERPLLTRWAVRLRPCANRSHTCPKDLSTLHRP